MAKTVEVDNSTINMLSSGTTIKGNISAVGDFRMDGILEGNIVLNGKLVVGESGKVIGNISCLNANIIGSVLGNITVKELLTLYGTASIKGDIVVNKLSVEPGASFTGTCKMFDEVHDEQSYAYDVNTVDVVPQPKNEFKN